MILKISAFKRTLTVPWAMANYIYCCTMCINIFVCINFYIICYLTYGYYEL